MINLSDYQGQVFLRTEELFSTQGYRNVPLFENEYRLSKATAEYIRDNISTSGGSVNNDAARTYNAVLGIIISSDETANNIRENVDGDTGDNTTNNTSDTTTTNNSGVTTNTISVIGVLPTLQSLTDYVVNDFGFVTIFTFSYSNGITVGTQLTPVAPTQNVPNGYYIIRNLSEPNSVYNSDEYYIQVLQGSIVGLPTRTANLQSGDGGGIVPPL
jgi:hypothetical protein